MSLFHKVDAGLVLRGSIVKHFVESACNAAEDNLLAFSEAFYLAGRQRLVVDGLGGPVLHPRTGGVRRQSAWCRLENRAGHGDGLKVCST